MIKQQPQAATVATAHSDFVDATAAGEELGRRFAAAFAGEPPDAVIVFASSTYDHERLLTAIDAQCHPKLLTGSSSAGEFIRGAFDEGSVCAVALRSPNLQFAVGIGHGIARDSARVARDIVAAFPPADARFPYRAALVMTDALAGHADELVEHLVLATDAQCKFFGGGAGDDARFQRTHVFLGNSVYTDAAIGVEIRSTKPIGIGVAHGWEPASRPMRVTESAGMRLISLNARPAAEVFTEHARATGQQLDPKAPIPFFLHNVLGIESPGGHYLRVPLAIGEDGSVSCAAEIPTGSVVTIMSAVRTSAADATRAALTQLEGNAPQAAFFFDCVATRLRMGADFGFEREAVEGLIGGSECIGCNTYGQIARAEGQFNGFHNCTAVVCVLPA